METNEIDRPKILMILSSTREGRAGERFARWFYGIAQQRSDLTVELVDLRDWPLPFFSEPASPSSGRHAAEADAWAQLIEYADGFVIVTPEYNFGYPAVLKNALDHLYIQWNRKPVGFVSYGGPAGGARAVQQLREVAIELQMVPIRNAVAIPFARRAWGEDDQLKDQDIFAASAERLLDELSWYAHVLKAGRLGYVPTRTS